MQDVSQSFARLVYALAEASRRGDSGTFFVTTDDQRSVRIGMEEGQLCHCSLRGAGGLAAWEMLLHCGIARFALQKNSYFPFREIDRFEHESALSALEPELSLAFMTPVRPEIQPEPIQGDNDHGTEQAANTIEGGEARTGKKVSKVRYYRGFPVKE